MRKTIVKTSRKQDLIAAALFAALAIAGADAAAQKTEEELALAAQNPVAAMVSMPIQYNYDQKIGPREEAHNNYLHIQPVIPFSINNDWNLISRTIIPVIDLDLGGAFGSQRGMGDITQSLFFSPKKPTADGWIWGAGPVILLPTATNELGADKWGFGPTAVFLKQEHGWTYGALMNHIWSAGGSGRATISNTFLQPFLTYTTKTHTSFTVQTESSYDWNRDQWSVPIHLLVAQVFKVGEQAMQFQVGARYWAVSPDAGAHGWGARATLTLLFPR